MSSRRGVLDGNEAAARIAYKTNEVISVYPITPASPMGEFADSWAAKGEPNVWGTVPDVIEMQSEAGAAGAVHGALQGGALTTTFTASQGLLLMLPDMFKIAGELTATVFHIAARSVATHALSIFGDHSDVMAARSTGFAMLSASSVQEAQDFALIAQMATLASRVPFLHFFDGFRTSHEINIIELLDDDDIRALLDRGDLRAHRDRRLNPESPVLRGTAQNPDVFFQAREAINPFYEAAPGAVQVAMDQFAARTGRQYELFDYHGSADADGVLVLMGSAAGAAQEAVDALIERGERVGLVKIRLFRPFSAAAFVGAIPHTAKAIAVLDRTKEPGGLGEPLYEDVVTALAHEASERDFSPKVIGGRYGLASKEFTPAMAAAVFVEIQEEKPKNHFTIGIVDDVTHSSLDYDEAFGSEPDDVFRAVFYGLGSDGTVSANKLAAKIIGERADLHSQGYFVYDSKKAGAQTVSHLRFGPRPIRSTYLVREANFVGCHQFDFLDGVDVTAPAAPGATFLLSSPYRADEVWDHLPVEVQAAIIDKGLEFFVVDAARIAAKADLGNRINTVLLTCFFGLTEIIPVDEAISAIKEGLREAYGRFGEAVLERNYAAVDAALAGLERVEVPALASSEIVRRPVVPPEAPEFVQRVTARILAGDGDRLPVSALPVDGTFPTGTAKWEKRSLASEIPIWDAPICIDCAKCAIVCPHAAIRMKVYDPGALADAPDGFPTKEYSGKDQPGMAVTFQVAPDDCTGCGVCVDVCPAHSKENLSHKAIDMEPKLQHVDEERRNYDFFLSIPELDRSKVRAGTVKGSQMLEPLFEYSGACAGCGETPYLKLLTQLFGDRALIANATGCSSIYGGNLPTTPWSTNGDGRGPAWSNSLFEDNAEFGLGMRLALDRQRAYAADLLDRLRPELPRDLVEALLHEEVVTEEGFAAMRANVAVLKEHLADIDGDDAAELSSIADSLLPKSVWIVGGDGWAYDIGFGGLDHVLAAGRNVNVLVLDTEVYSNTGGQSSKATPRGAVAKFAVAGKQVGKKDLGMIASQYGNVYVAQVALGANQTQTVKAFVEAESWPGPSLIIAYSPCIAHGIDMATSMTHTKEAVDSGYWLLYRYDPRHAVEGDHPFHLDCRAPSIKFKDFAMKEARYAMLERSNPDEAQRLMRLAQDDITERWNYYTQIADIERTIPGEDEEDE